MGEKKYIIELRDVYMEYPIPHHGTKRVLNDVDLRVREGEFLTIVGPSGCGKSTLLGLLFGKEQPTSGHIVIDGEERDDINRDRGIVFQKYSLVPWLTARENIAFGFEMEHFAPTPKLIRHLLHRKAYKALNAKVDEYLERIGFTKEDAAKRPDQLSGGMQQRVAVAAAMIMKPKIFCMDEPFSALDAVTRVKMQQFILEQHQRKGMTIVFVTHELREALFLGTRVVALSQFYRTDNGGTPGTQGSKIISDFAVKRTATVEEKYSAELNEIEKQLMEDLDGAARKYIGEFDLRHPDSYRTVNHDEWEGQPEPKGGA